LLKKIKEFFKEVYCAKPKACRNSSVEAFVVAKGFLGSPALTSEIKMTDLLTTLNHLETYKAEYMDETIDDPS